ncbi:MAG: hypothetical protein WBV90_20370 [Terrimicrobiaceae bacterium]
MPQTQPISRKLPAAAALNFAELRQAGIDYLEKVVGALWSDYNVHDPGITLLELLCYGITDIAYRTTFPDAEIFAPAPGEPLPGPDDPPFTTARFALTNGPVTINDYRKLFLDRFAELRNVWLDPVTERLFANTKTRGLARKAGVDTVPFEVRGLYKVRLLFRDVPKAKRRKQVIEELDRFFHQNRNLCEDLADIGVTPLQDILVCAEIQLTPDADVEKTHASVVFALQNFLSPLISRYSLADLVERGLSPENIFDGPQLANGFILDEDLNKASSPSAIRSSDLLAEILGIPGVAAVIRFQLNYPPKEGSRSQPSEWELPIEPGHHPRLSDENARLDFFKGPLPLRSDPVKVAQHLKVLREDASTVAEVSGPFDRAIPAGTWRDLGDFSTLQEALPLNYGVGRRGFDASAPPDRLAKARQLQAFLLIFDQLLANYLGQLVNLRGLLSANAELRKSYFSNAVSDLPELRELLTEVAGNPATTPAEVRAKYTKLREESTAAHDDWVGRRSRIVDHLLARFGETFTDHVLMHYSVAGASTPEETLKKKCAFLTGLSGLSYHRLQAHDILDAGRTWDTANVSGFEKRLGQLLGLSSSNRRNLSDAGTQDSAEGVFLIENLLLRPRPGAPQSWPLLPASCACVESTGPAASCSAEEWDPYSFRTHLIFPGYSARLIDPGFRRFVEEIVRRELPAHLEAKICFVSRELLADFEQKYRAWLESLASGKPKATVLQALVDCLNELHTIYPAGTLHDCREDGDEASAIVLNQSRLGTLPPDQ